MKKLPAIGAVLLAAVIVLAWHWLSSVPIDKLISQARLAVERRDARTAEELCARILEREPENPEGLLLSALISAETGRFSDAVEFCTRVPQDSGKSFIDSRIMAGNICIEQLGLVTRSEQFFGELLAIQPDHTVANDRMVYLLGLQSRIRELIPYYLRVLRKSPRAAVKIQLLMQGELAYPDLDLTQQLQKSDPTCAGLVLAEAHLAFLSKDYATAENLCRQAVKMQPDFAEAQARLGLVLLQTGTAGPLKAWCAALPGSVKQHPEILYVTGRIALLDQLLDEATRCFWESLLIDPNQVAANYHLGRSLVAMGRSEDANAFLNRAVQVERYQKQLESASPDTLLSTPDSAEFEAFLIRAEESMEMAQRLGLIWETYSWVVIAAQAPHPPEWARKQLRSLQKRLNDFPLARTLRESNPAAQMDLSNLPMPEFSPDDARMTPESTTRETTTPETTEFGTVTFEEIGAEHGLQFVFDNGFPRPREAQIRSYDFTGGGVGIVDLDGDSWPDLCFSQGCSLIDRSGQDPIRQNEGVFRNLRGKLFQDVTAIAFPGIVDYSQGVSVGDYNSDGFSDVLIANLGRNRLLRNNGDGTFSSDPDATKEDSGVWTTSAVICDLNNDSHPDLYFVNYLSGDILNRICSDGNHRYGNCSPQNFPAEQDQLLLNQGDGSFKDVTDESGIRVANGKGLGIVAADFNDDHRLDLFISNDGVPNFYFDNQSASNSPDVRFVEQAMERGAAVNGSGQSEACMGIVADDLDQDGQVDLFVTNFYGETNTVYRGVSETAIFEDVTSRTVPGMAGLRTLGFGTQSIDGELDGWPDLFVLNGHVDSYPGRDVPYRMLPQYFANAGKLQFVEVPGESISAWFTRPGLGRAAARLDWNRDGADDLVVTHLDSPAAVLSNTTIRRGNFLALYLIATASDRSATGTTVMVSTPTMDLVRHVTAGDGYQASNEKTLLFGLGGEATLKSLTVQWPSGAVQEIRNACPNQSYVVVEGRADAMLLPK